MTVLADELNAVRAELVGVKESHASLHTASDKAHLITTKNLDEQSLRLTKA